MKQIEGVLSYKEAKPYMEKVKKYLRSFRQLSVYNEHLNAKLTSLHTIAMDKGKKMALMHFDGGEYSDYEIAYDEYKEALEADLYRANHFVQSIECALDNIDKKCISDIIKYCYIHGGTCEDAEERFCYGISAIARYKKIGLARIAEQMFGIVIDV